ncbi:MAG: oligosaccharyl transferase, archaeosortase A system-associated [Methanimicrococcus sp.]|nr:oligosaccharyl transferase, archaeosortase A system-associated [Methanimicrococcus sp.]
MTSAELNEAEITETEEDSEKQNRTETKQEVTSEKKGPFGSLFDKSKFEDKNSLMTSAFYGVAVLISALLAFYIRIRPRAGVFLENGFIRLGENDPWYHWRNIDYLLHNYPHMMWFDPATTYPYGTSQAFAPLFDIMTATVIKFLQIITGNETEQFAMTIFAYWPCFLAALCVIAVYFAAKKIFDSRPIGLFSAFLLAVAPGQFLSRSIIGFSDHHVAEVLFSTLTIFFLVATLLKAKDKIITYEELFKGKLSGFKPILPYAILTGATMAAYTLVWEGALLFAFIIGIFITVQMMINHLRKEGTAFIAVTGIIIFLIDLCIVIITPQIGEYKTLHILALSAGIIAMAFMALLSYVLDKKKLDEIFYPAILVGLLAIGSVTGSLISETIKNALLGVVGFFTRTGGALTIGEASPFFTNIYGQSIVSPLIFTIITAALVFTIPLLATKYLRKDSHKQMILIGGTCTFLIILFASGAALKIYQSFSVMGYIWIIALPMLAYSAVKNNSMEKTLLAVWTIVLLWSLVQQNRFSYYFIVPSVILTAWIFRELAIVVKAEEAWVLLKKNFLSEDARKKKDEPAPVYSSKQEVAKSRRQSSKVKASKKDNGNEKIAIAAVVLIVALGFILVPTYGLTVQYTSGTGGPNEAWIGAALWMKDNTPVPGLDWYGRYEEPLQDIDGDGIPDKVAGIGIEYFENQASIVPFDYPGVAYGVLSWWDYGHWLEVIGKRMVNANPFQFGVGGRRGNVTDEMIPGAAPFFVAESEKEATRYLTDIDPREGYVGARYIVTDIEMASGMSKFYAMTAWTLDMENYRIVVDLNGQNQSIIGSERYFDSMVFRLHMLDANGLEQYRFVYESIPASYISSMASQEMLYKDIYNQFYNQNISTSNTGYVKVFEYVEGAVLTGKAEPNATVNLSLTIQTNQYRIYNYAQSTTADANGNFSFRVPYSTTGPTNDSTNFAVKPMGGYTIKYGSTEARVDVTERDVLNGNTVRVVF